MSDIPRWAISRSAKLASLPLGVAGRATLGLGKRLGGRPAELVATELQTRTAEQIFKVLGELKGGAMKLGQALSVFEAALPDELAAPYRAALTRLQEAAPPLPAAAVHGVLRRELGRDWRRSFTAFDDTPAAAASVGQVHRATWADGQTVAVKVQYPGAGPALLSDFTQLARLARLFSALSPGLDIKPLLEELRERVAEELDYRLEAAAQSAFAAAYDGDPDVVVPKVVAFTERLLVSEWIDGTPLSAVIAAGSQEERDRAGQLLIRFLFSGPARAGMLHADPHPGNYRLTPDGRLGVLDYGAVNRLPDGLPGPIGELCRLALAGDADAVLDGLSRQGFVKPTISVDAAAALDYLVPLLEPVRRESFRFSRSWLRTQAGRIADPRSPAAALGRQLNLPPAYMLIHRVTLGGLGVLCQLGSEVAVRGEMERWLPGFLEGPGPGASRPLVPPPEDVPTPEQTSVVQPPADDTVLTPRRGRPRRDPAATAAAPEPRKGTGAAGTASGRQTGREASPQGRRSRPAAGMPPDERELQGP